MYHPDIKSGNNKVLALMFDMNLLWEKYVYRQLQKKLNGKYIVKDQVSTNFWKPEKGRMMQLKPDIVVYDKEFNPITVLDTKWKNPGGNKPSPEDLRQMLAYNYYQNCRHSSLLYPYSGDKSFSMKGHYQKDEKQCSLIFLPLEKINQRMDLGLNAIELFIEACAKERNNEEPFHAG
jgi:5-methylcytosine-specific restriction enzyme subunit McrC